MASNRKNKLICYWDYELELKWECVKKINANDKITGMAQIYDCLLQFIIIQYNLLYGMRNIDVVMKCVVR